MVLQKYYDGRVLFFKIVFWHSWTFCMNLKEKSLVMFFFKSHVGHAASSYSYFLLANGLLFFFIFFLSLSKHINLQWNFTFNHLITHIYLNYKEKITIASPKTFVYIYHNPFVRLKFCGLHVLEILYLRNYTSDPSWFAFLILLKD